MHPLKSRAHVAALVAGLVLPAVTCHSSTSPSTTPSGFTIQLQYYGPTPTAAEQTAINTAKARWESIITGALSPIVINKAAGLCGAGEPALANDTIANVLILVTFDSIDGPGKTLAQAGPCEIRNASGLTAVGVIDFDTADVGSLISSGQLGTVALHEMAHVLGFGVLWSNAPINCLALPSTPPGTILDTYFSCPKARAAFDSIGGTSYTGQNLVPKGGNKVPVENCGASSPTGCGAGTVNSHWRKPVFGNELMTGYVSAGANPLSVVTIAAQADIGYAVNYAAADPFVHTFTAPPAGGAAPLALGDDILHGPIYAVDAAGRVRSVIRR